MVLFGGRFPLHQIFPDRQVSPPKSRSPAQFFLNSSSSCVTYFPGSRYSVLVLIFVVGFVPPYVGVCVRCVFSLEEIFKF